jgi:uncharacterized protein (TIGR00255 family)
MTGFGQAAGQAGGRRLAVEVRSVNQRFLDVRLGLPREYQQFEESLRKIIQANVERGKVDVSVNCSGSSKSDYDVEVNEPMARAVVDGWRRLQKRLGLPGEIDVSMVLNRGDFVRVVERREEVADLPRLQQLLETALKAFNKAREREGKALARDMKDRVANLRRIEGGLSRRTALLVPELQRRLSQRLNALLADQQISPERLTQEAAVLAERADVTEELVRLGSHLERLVALLGESGSIGKPVDFLLQEVHRELNTIASKSADLEVTNLTLVARAEIEKLREQVQNVE